MPSRNEEALRFKSEKSGRPVLCTGGRSYWVIRGDGKMYRCLYNPVVVGTIFDEDLRQLGGKEMTCLWKNAHDSLTDSCHPSGDLMFATYWDLEGGRATRRQAPWSGSKWQEPDDPRVAEPCSDKAFFQVLPVNSRCNLACPYCCNFYYEDEDGKVVGRPRDHAEDLPMAAWTTFLERAARKLRFAHFGFLGGEPTMYSHMAELTATICNDRGWEVGICSNMMKTSVFEDIVSRLRPEARPLFRASASLHPFSRNFRWENYWESVRLLRDAGIVVRATMVSWPEQIHLYDDYSAQLAELGVHLHLKGIGGYDLPKEDWDYIGSKGGTAETPDYLKRIGWF
jgi:MoaA/NifB/PqqE/SkfB family radical SAM enzyme